MAVGDRFSLTVVGNAVTSGQSIDNVFCYEGIDGLATAVDLNQAFIGDVLQLILNMSSAQYHIGELLTINLDDPDDFSTVIVDDVGALAGDYMPIFVSAGFRYVRTTRAAQNGRKTLGIIPEDQVNAGTPSAPYLILLNILADALGNDIDGGVPVSIFRPRIWRRPGVYQSGTVAEPGAFFPVGSVNFTRITTMNSRKIGA